MDIRRNLSLTKYLFLKQKDFIKKITNREYANILKKNKRFKNSNDRDCCYIIGNGPSIKKQDISFLKDETVFCVNQCFRNEQIFDIDPDFYVCVDSNLFNIDPNKTEDVELLNTYKGLGKFKNMQCFFPIDSKDTFILKHGIDKILNVNYIEPKFKLFDFFPFDFNLSSIIPFYGTVVQTAITIAIYMGYKKIILLGCDETGIVVTVNSVLKKNNDSYYSYNITENEKRRMENMVSNAGFENYCSAYLYMVQAFRMLNNYARNNNIEIVNASAETVIDSIPRVQINDLIRRKK